jgi:hypothetical protein
MPEKATWTVCAEVATVHYRGALPVR